ncbi:MAG TPA: S-layer homology domain-containing protein, partial [Anaerolineales bacterium]|nr:S-layer homology domain-containing protein [Anaerolineales bacterium]
TRGQVVTIFNNIYEMGGGTGGYIDFAADTVLGNDWIDWENPYLREAAWTDVSVGAYYAIPVLRAYGIGVAEGTSATTFSPDQAATRGEFAKMLYRAISKQ